MIIRVELKISKQSSNWFYIFYHYKNTFKLGLVVQACNPSYLRGEDRRIMVQGQGMRPYLKNNQSIKELEEWLKW
jgi:hypothetical protein